MPTATVDLDAITANVAAVRSQLEPGTKLMPAVKADAYGHGAVAVAGALERAGVDWFGLATANEVLELRHAGNGADLLLLTPAFERIGELLDAGAAFILPDHATLDRLVGAGARGARVHVKVDTGLGRLGRPPKEATELAIAAERAGLVVQGVMSHFASAEDDPDLTRLQLDRFHEALALMRTAGIEPEFRHISNSAGILAHGAAGGNMARPGLLCYGYSPLPAAHAIDAGLTPALTLTAPVTMVKRVPAGQGLSYNHRFVTDRPTNILTVRCGYGDGYRRLLTNRAWAEVRGQRLRLRGSVAMDQLLLDAGELEVEPGETVTLIGGSGPSAVELGELAESNAYDILTSLTRRVDRRFIHGAGPA